MKSSRMKPSLSLAFYLFVAVTLSDPGDLRDRGLVRLHRLRFQATVAVVLNFDYGFCEHGAVSTGGSEDVEGRSEHLLAYVALRIVIASAFKPILTAFQPILDRVSEERSPTTRHLKPTGVVLFSRPDGPPDGAQSHRLSGALVILVDPVVHFSGPSK